jgi:hypothetical protein
LVHRPESRRIRGQHLVGEDEAAVRRDAELHFRVGQQDAAWFAQRATAIQHRDGQAPQPGRAVRANFGHHLVVRHWLVMIGRAALGRGREDRLGQP